MIEAKNKNPFGFPELPEPTLYDFYKDLDNRCFWIDDQIDACLLCLAKYIIRWNKEDHGLPREERVPIKLFFFSPGGDLDTNYTLIDVIEASETPIIGINVGQCCSAAAYIYLSCHKRYMLKHSYFLYHQGSGNFSGTFLEVCAQMQDYQTQVDELVTLLVNKTKYTAEEIGEKISGEWYIREKEAIEKGVAHGVINNLYELLEGEI